MFDNHSSWGRLLGRRRGKEQQGPFRGDTGEQNSGLCGPTSRDCVLGLITYSSWASVPHLGPQENNTGPRLVTSCGRIR